MAFAHYLQIIFSEAVSPDNFTLNLTDTDPRFSVSLQDFTDPEKQPGQFSQKTRTLKRISATNETLPTKCFTERREFYQASRQC